MPRCRDLTPLTAELLPAYLAYFDRFSKDRNLMPKLSSGDVDPAGLYVLSDGDSISGHVQIENRKHFDGVNRMDPDGLYVKQLGFTDPAALARVLGFLRMFEGEQAEVILRDIGPTPEVNEFLRHYMHTSYELRPDIMAKVLDIPAVLAACAYEPGSGAFSIRVGNAVYARSADGSVDRVDNAGAADIAVSLQALTRLAFGADKYNVDSARGFPQADERLV